MAKARTVLNGLQFENAEEAKQLHEAASDAWAGFGAIAVMAAEVRELLPTDAQNAGHAGAMSILDGIEVLAKLLKDRIGPVDKKLSMSWTLNFDAE